MNILKCVEITVADSGFPWKVCASSQKCYYFANFLPKIAWKLKKFEPQGGGGGGARIPGALHPPMENVPQTWFWKKNRADKQRQKEGSHE